MISSSFESIKHFIASQLQSNAAAEGNTRPGETNDAAAPRSHNSKQLHSSTAASSSPTTLCSRILHHAQPSSSSSTGSRATSFRRPTISADERRLVGDYSTPADAIFIFPPTEWGSSSLSMKHKSGGFQPGLNTIGDNPFQAPITYGSPSWSRGPGQKKFMKKTINASESNTTDASYNSCGSSPRKRQKTTYTSAIDLDTDNDVVLLGAKSPRPGNLYSSPEGAPSMASKSQRSHEIVQSTKHRQPPVSSFKDTDNLLNSRRKKSRSGSRVAPPKSRPCNSLSEDDLQSEAPAEESINRDELAQESGLESHHWSYNASGVPRINPSTPAEGGMDRDNRSTRKKNSDNLRDNFRRRRGDSIENDEQDELQVIGEGTARRVQDHSKSPGRHGTQGNTKIKQKGRIALPRWPLIYARSTYHKPDGSELALNLSADKVFQLVYLDTGNIATDLSIDLKKIREAEADEVSRIRLKGSRDQAGNQLLFDLEFANNDQFKVFCDSYVKPNTTNKKIFLRDQEYMDKLHRLTLPVRPELEPPTVVDDHEPHLLEARTQNGRQVQSQAPPRRDLLINKMAPGKPSPSVREIQANSGAASTTREEIASSLSRPFRSTRNNRVHYDLVEEERPAAEDRIPYSVQPGLGKPWDKPLPYIHGKRRALVNFTDLERLDEDVFLNDSLIDFYLIYLFEQANIPADKVYFFNTMFYSTLTRNVTGDKGAINYAGVARWTAKEDLFNYDYIVVPINESSHWYLAIICNVNNIPRKLNKNVLGTSSPAAQSTAEATSEPSGQRIEDELALAAASDTSGEPLVPGHSEASVILDEGDSRINLINADTVDADGDLAAATVEAIPVQTSPAAETARMEELSLSDSLTNKVSKQPASASLSAKKKTKKKPLPKYDPDKSIIVILDSLEGTHAKAVRVLKDYILEEGRAKRGMEATIEQKTFYVKSNHIPMQENYSDCGVFLLGYAEKFFANPREFSNRLLLREMDTQTDWPNMNASDMRHAMRKIIQDLAEKQKAEQKRNKKFTKAMKVAPLPPVKTDLPSSTPRLQSPFQEKPPHHTEVRSQSSRQPSSTKIEGLPIEETLSSPVNTGLPAPNSKQQSHLHVKSPAKSETHLKLPRQPSLAKGEVSPPRRERKPSPIVAIPTTEWNSPKRQISTMVENCDSPTTGTAALHPADRVQLAVEIRSPKRQKQSHARTISSRHLSPEKLKAATRLSSKSHGPNKKASLPDGKQLYPTGYARDFRSQRGSSADPIPIDDSQDGATTLTPKQIERQTSVELTKTASSRTPKKTNRSTPTVEKSTMLSTATGEGEVIPDSPEEKRRSPRHGVYK